MAVVFNETLLTEIRQLLNSSSIDLFYSKELLERSVLQAQIDEKLKTGEFSCSVSHSKSLGGAAFINANEGQIGFDLEESIRVHPEVALRVSDPQQLRAAPTPAALFTAKEAAFKSLRGHRQPKVLSEVEILEWSKANNSLPQYRFISRLKGQQFQWFGVCFLDSDHAVALSVFPHSS